MKIVNSLIANCFAILELLAAEARNMRLSDIADRLELQRSGVHRVLTTLVGLGWVEQDEGGERYRLSLKLSAIGYRFMQGVKLPDVYQPVVDRVAKESHELVRLAVLANRKLTTVAHAQGAQGSLICSSRTFPVLPVHVTASGKAWLATLPREEALRLALEAGLGRKGQYGRNAITSADALIQQLDRAVELGYAAAWDEAEDGLAAVAAAVRPDSEDAVGALAIVAPSFRMRDERVAELAKIVVAGAADLALVWPLRAIPSEDDRATGSAAA
jgi:DNA-binding IclR family transcriptional regulator